MGQGPWAGSQDPGPRQAAYLALGTIIDGLVQVTDGHKPEGEREGLKQVSGSALPSLMSALPDVRPLAPWLPSLMFCLFPIYVSYVYIYLPTYLDAEEASIYCFYYLP